MQNKIALEEHFAIDLAIGGSQVYARPEVWTGLKSNEISENQRRKIGRGNACKLFNLP